MGNRIEQKIIAAEISDSSKTSITSKSSDSNFEAALKNSEDKLDQDQINPFIPWGYLAQILSGTIDSNFSESISFSDEKLNPRKVSSASSINSGLQTQKHPTQPQIFGDINQKQYSVDQTKKAAESNFKSAPVNQVSNNAQFLFPLKNMIEELKNKLLLKGIDIKSLSEEIIDRVKMIKDKGKTELQIELIPKELGLVTLNVSSMKGILTINLSAASNVAETLNSRLDELAKNLKNANLAVGNLSVSVGNGYNFNYNQNQWQDQNFEFGETNIFAEKTHFTQPEDSYILSKKLGYLKDNIFFSKI